MITITFASSLVLNTLISSTLKQNTQSPFQALSSFNKDPRSSLRIQPEPPPTCPRAPPARRGAAGPPRVRLSPRVRAHAREVVTGDNVIIFLYIYIYIYIYM